MALNLVEYKSPVQNVIAYARIACLLLLLSLLQKKENVREQLDARTHAKNEPTDERSNNWTSETTNNRVK